MKPGVYDISIEAYHDGPGISRSTLMEFQRSPLHYKHKYIDKRIPKRKAPDIITSRDALEFGNALHTYILEADLFNEQYILTMGKVNKTTLNGRAALKELQAEAEGRMILDREAFITIQRMADAAENHVFSESLFKNSDFEKSMYWVDSDTGLLCKARPDIWGRTFIADLKTARDGSPEAFSKAVHNYGYYMQCAMMYEGVRELTGREIENFFFLVVEKDEPHAVGVYQLEMSAVLHGVKVYKEMLANIKECIECDYWPSYPSTVIQLPNYVTKDKEEL